MCAAYEIGERGKTVEIRILPPSVMEMLQSFKTSLIRPTVSAPVILPEGHRMMSWGFRRKFASKQPGGKPTMRAIVNARSDRLDSPIWRAAIRERRCLIPVAAYFEWSDISGTKQSYRFESINDDWLWVAGIWEHDQEHGDCYSMITCEPNTLAAQYHSRMPAVLTVDQLEPFLAGDIQSFNPPAEMLKAAAVPSPLKQQGELF